MPKLFPMPAPGTLFLLPVPIADGGISAIPSVVADTACSIRHFIVENEKTARKNLKLFGYTNLPGAQLQVLNEHTPAADVAKLLYPLTEGHNAGLMSDAGCPGIADPGAELIRLCHRRGIRVVPLPGPSSIMLSVMASGFNGQSFAFVGYLPVDRQQRARRLKELETFALRTRQAQFFIETPYRNVQLFQAAVSLLQPTTHLFIGCDMGSDAGFVRSCPVGEWKSAGVPDLNKRPAVFGIFG